MKLTSSDAFDKHIKGAAPQHFAAVYLILGKDQYECNLANEKLLKALLGDADPSLCLKRFRGEKPVLAQVMQELEMIPFLGSRTIVALQQVDKLGADDLRKLVTYLEAPNPSSVLVMSADALAANTKLYKAVEKLGVVLSLAEQKAWQKEKALPSWIAEYLAKQGVQIDATAAQALAKQVGSDKGLLQGELDKLICYLGERKHARLGDVTEICSVLSHDSIWQLGESIFAGKSADAIRTGRQLIMDGVAAFALLRQLRTQFQTDFQVCSLLSNGGTAQDVTKRFPYMKGWLLDQHVRAATRYGLKRFQRGLLLIDEADVFLKNSQADPAAVMDVLLAKLST